MRSATRTVPSCAAITSLANGRLHCNRPTHLARTTLINGGVVLRTYRISVNLYVGLGAHFVISTE